MDDDWPDLHVTFTTDADGYVTDWHGSPDSYGTEDMPDATKETS